MPIEQSPERESSSFFSNLPSARDLWNARLIRNTGLLTLLTIVAVVIWSSYDESTPERVLRRDRDFNAYNLNASNIHVLLPATNEDVNLCKTMLGLSVLGYRTPTLLAWDEEADAQFMVAKGAHILSKVTRQLEYFERLPGNDEDLFLLVDGFDTWFQLRPEVLIERYKQINAQANHKLRTRLGMKAIDAVDMRQTVIFGASKTCSNQPHTLGCYAVPLPPTREDLYGPNTDTEIGRNEHASFRPRYLADGFMLGPARELREILRRAQYKIETIEDYDRDTDNGSGGSNFLYHGSATSIFARIYGEQEYAREALRRTYSKSRSWWGYVFGAKADSAAKSNVGGLHITDRLEPAFTHERMPLPETEVAAEAVRNYEFGIGLDYANELGMQMLNSETDGTYLYFSPTHTDMMGEPPIKLSGQQEMIDPGEDLRLRIEHGHRSIAEQINDSPRNPAFDCIPRVPDVLPDDILKSRKPYAAAPEQIVTYDGGESPQDAPSHTDWANVKLYTNLCHGTIPVMIHHNGDAALKKQDYDKIWWQRYGSTLLEAAKDKQDQAETWELDPAGAPINPEWVENTKNRKGRRGKKIGAWGDKGEFLSWQDLCPREWERELFGELWLDD